VLQEQLMRVKKQAAASAAEAKYYQEQVGSNCLLFLSIYVLNIYSNMCMLF
jgi:hypothetical protein